MADVEDEAPTSVLDLPQLYSKPSTTTLLSTLSKLAINPSSFNESQTRSSLRINEDGLTGYLTRFVASSLAWITSDKEKEEIWEAASQRLSERSGRMAMSSMSRTFTICDFAVKRDGAAPRYINIKLNEPSLTEDNVGHKTWTGSFLLAKRLPHTMAKHFPALLASPTPKSSPSACPNVFESSRLPDLSPCLRSEALNLPSPPPSPKALSSLPSWTNPLPLRIDSISTPVTVLELGAGTGLTGMAAAALFTNISVHLTDLPAIVPNLIANVESNSHLFACPPSTAILDWSKLPLQVRSFEQYDCILAADSLYDPRHPNWLTNAMSLFLKREKEARVIVELPFRDMDLPYHRLLREEMAEKGFVILEEGEESGWDDWEGAWCEKMAVRCWWSVWGWKECELGLMLNMEEAGNTFRGAKMEQYPGQGNRERDEDDNSHQTLGQYGHVTSHQWQQRQKSVSEQLLTEQTAAAMGNLHRDEEVSNYPIDAILDEVESSPKKPEKEHYVLPHLRGVPF